MIAETPKPPYYAVIFSSLKSSEDIGYAETGARMMDLASQQTGFLGVESAREDLGITVSYWRDLDSIKQWKQNIEHIQAQKKGKKQWYDSYRVRIAKVEKEYGFK
jgi:heme-degrading monooxygenase HmoA